MSLSAEQTLEIRARNKTGGNAVFSSSCVQNSIENFAQAIIPRTLSLVVASRVKFAENKKVDRQAFKNPMGRGRATDHPPGRTAPRQLP